MIVIGLDTMQVDVEILYIFAGAVAGGLGLALAIGLGIALGLGGRDYVAENIDDWVGQASREMEASETEPKTYRTESDAGRADSDLDD